MFKGNKTHLTQHLKGSLTFLIRTKKNLIGLLKNYLIFWRLASELMIEKNQWLIGIKYKVFAALSIIFWKGTLLKEHTQYSMLIMRIIILRCSLCIQKIFD